MNDALCPCGTGKTYAACCGLYIDGGQLAPDPEALMRSRYTAFYRCNYPYLKKTWHPETYPEDLEQGEPSNWVGLEIVESDWEDDEGEVEFKARLIFENRLEVLHEISSFDKVDGAWLYHSGEFLNEDEPVKIARNAPCPCGSGKTFKDCHYEV
jgi:SEC-C motif-containing protein